MRRRAVVLAAALALVAPGTLARAEDESALFDRETGFRIQRYRAPTPPDVPGGKRITIDELDEIRAQEPDVLLLDVSPTDGAGLDPATGRWRKLKPHATIPGAVWVPDVGRGRLDAPLDDYLSASLKRLSGGTLSRAIVVFCQADCWMGWNAVQRIASAGFSRVLWYADGTDGWRDWDRELVPVAPLAYP